VIEASLAALTLLGDIASEPTTMIDEMNEKATNKGDLEGSKNNLKTIVITH
jgi:hypothetical protein